MRTPLRELNAAAVAPAGWTLVSTALPTGHEADANGNVLALMSSQVDRFEVVSLQMIMDFSAAYLMWMPLKGVDPRGASSRPHKQPQTDAEMAAQAMHGMLMSINLDRLIVRAQVVLVFDYLAAQCMGGHANADGPDAAAQRTYDRCVDVLCKYATTTLGCNKPAMSEAARSILLSPKFAHLPDDVRNTLLDFLVDAWEDLIDEEQLMVPRA